MRSPRPKPLHLLGGRPMVYYVLDATALDGVLATVVVVGFEATWTEKVLRQRHSDVPLRFVEQVEQLGTGHAVAVALPTVAEVLDDADGDVVIVPGDAPLLRRSTMADLVTRHRERGAALSVLTATVADPSGYGRIVRAKDGSVARIVEERDATQSERAILEVNTAIMVVRSNLLGPGLRRVDRQNAQQEYYLTDLVAVLHEAGHATYAVALDDAGEAFGVNDRAQLAAAEAVVRARVAGEWLRRGVTIWDPATTYIDPDVELGDGVSLLPGTVLRGHCVVGAGASIGPNAHLLDCRVGADARLGTIEGERAVVGAGAVVGSFSVLAPGTEVAPGAVVGPGSHLPA